MPCCLPLVPLPSRAGGRRAWQVRGSSRCGLLTCGLRCAVCCGRGTGRADGQTSEGQIRTGDMVVFCKPVAVAPAVVRRDGRVPRRAPG